MSYRLVSARPERSLGDPDFDTVAGHVRTALSSKGMFAAPAGVAPDVLVEIDFGVDETGREETTHRIDMSDPYSPVPLVITVHEKFLRLTARTNPAGGASRELWSVFVTNEDESAAWTGYDILLVSAAMDAIGDQTEEQRRVTFSARDRRVAFVARGM